MPPTSEKHETPPGSFFERLWKNLWTSSFFGTFIRFVVDTIINFFSNEPIIRDIKKRSDHVVVLTGGTRGIGLSVVKKLIELDCTILLGVRNISECESQLEKIRKHGISSTAKGRVKVFPLNLKSLASVRQFANQVLQSEEGSRIDVLLNNAGTAHLNYETTHDNLEDHFQVNYLSHFLLTQLLLPRIKDTSKSKGKPCQIISTSSYFQRGGKIDFGELEISKVYSPLKCYMDSKLCLVMHAAKLEEMLQSGDGNVHAYAVHPGEIPTDQWLNLVEDIGFGLKLLYRICLPAIRAIHKTPDYAADTILQPLLVTEIGEAGAGGYLQHRRILQPNAQAGDAEACTRLWEKSMKLCNME